MPGESTCENEIVHKVIYTEFLLHTNSQSFQFHSENYTTTTLYFFAKFSIYQKSQQQKSQ